MSNYVILTDSACDLHDDVLRAWDVDYKSLTFKFNDSDKEYSNAEMPIKDFYNKMREGGVAKTAALNTENFAEMFEKYLSEGKDVIYLAFSSGLSNTYNASRLAVADLAEKYPERKIYSVDTLAASAGEGLLVYLAVEKKKSGADIDELKEYIESMIPNTCMFFTVDDLVYLKRGGRVSPTVAFVGGLLGIKPVLHVDNEGHLINIGKVRGRKAALTALADKYSELATDKENGTVYISHGDCEQDARALADMLKERHGVEVQIITDVGAVIGAHSGPGTLALFFIGTER